MRPTTITPARAKRLRQAVASGESNRSVARALGVDEGTIRGWRRKLALDVPAAVRSKRGTAKASPRPAEPRAAAVAPPTVPELERLLPELQAEPVNVEGTPLEVARAQHRRWTKSLRDLEPAFLRGEIAATSYSKLAELQQAAAREIATLTPPSAPDPSTDPTTRELASVTVSKLRQLVATERQRTQRTGGPES